MRLIGFMDERHVDVDGVCALHGDRCLERSGVWPAEWARLQHVRGTDTTHPKEILPGAPAVRVVALERPIEGSLDGAVIAFPLYPTAYAERPVAILYFGSACDRWVGDIGGDHTFHESDGKAELRVVGVRVGFSPFADELPPWGVLPGKKGPWLVETRELLAIREAARDMVTADGNTQRSRALVAAVDALLGDCGLPRVRDEAPRGEGGVDARPKVFLHIGGPIGRPNVKVDGRLIEFGRSLGYEAGRAKLEMLADELVMLLEALGVRVEVQT